MREMGYWVVLLAGIAGEFVVPLALRVFYRKYHIIRDGVGKLSNPQSPVQWYSRAWQLLSGCAMITGGVGFWHALGLWGLPLLITLVLYGAFGRIGLGVLSVVDVHDLDWAPAALYRIFRFTGFFCLQFGVLWLSAFLFACGPSLQIPRMAGALLLVSSLMGILAYAMSRMSRRKEFSGTVLGLQGLWEFLCFAFLYVPLAVWAVWILSLV